ncbi:hypothetical protein [Pseudodesulfovibrio indicus]|uniref:hypothetical protein n=1 Tax=Pseudodesulfovibrio indicus TaxID=1716143 RepID=UPI00292FC45C|nr:hypothetical protein [Pseudodesulfovibrio indicus]
MTTIMPQSELARKAIAWICAMRECKEPKPLASLIEEAGVRFNLGPKDAEFLMRFFKENKA